MTLGTAVIFPEISCRNEKDTMGMHRKYFHTHVVYQSVPTAGFQPKVARNGSSRLVTPVNDPSYHNSYFDVEFIHLYL